MLGSSFRSSFGASSGAFGRTPDHRLSARLASRLGRPFCSGRAAALAVALACTFVGAFGLAEPSHADTIESFYIDPTRSHIEFLRGEFSAQVAPELFAFAPLEAQPTSAPVPLTGHFVAQIGGDLSSPTSVALLLGTSDVRPLDLNLVSPGVGGGAGFVDAAFGVSFLDGSTGFAGEVAARDLVFGLNGFLEVFPNATGPLGLRGNFGWTSVQQTFEVATNAGLSGTVPFGVARSSSGFVWSQDTQYVGVSPGVVELHLPFQFSIRTPDPVPGPLGQLVVSSTYTGTVVATNVVPEPGTAILVGFGLGTLATRRRRAREVGASTSGRHVPANARAQLRSGRGGSGRRTALISMLVLTGTLGVGCGFLTDDPIAMQSPPSFDGEEQVFSTYVDLDRDGVLEDEDMGMLTAGAAAPGVLSQSASTNEVTLSLTRDFDSIVFACEHEVNGAAGISSCAGTARGRFVFADGASGDGARFLIALLTLPGELPSGFLSRGIFDVTIACGIPGSAREFRVGLTQQKTLNVPADAGAGACDVTIVLEFSEAVSQGETLRVVHSLSVTALDVGEISCATDSDCPGVQPICGPSGVCQDGGTADACIVPAVHCDPSRPFCDGQCSAGMAASPCRWEGECADGYTCDAGLCRGAPCASDTDCTDPAAGICTDLGCSGEGLRGDGCFSGSGCSGGICISNVCIDALAEGDDCTQPNTVCADGSLCRVLTGTCELPLPTGSACDENNACTQPFDSCIAGECTPKSSTGGPCEETGDCSGLPCKVDEGICGF